MLDALTFFASALMLRRIRAPHDVPHPGPRPSVTTEIHEGLKLVWNNRTLLALAWLAGLWQILHHMQVAVLILFATRELGLSAGAIGLTYVFGGLGCVLAAAFARAAVRALRRRARHRARARADGARLAGVRADLGAGLVRDARARHARC